MLILIYNNAQILVHPNVTVQYLKSIPFVAKAWKTCVHTSVSNKNQLTSQTKGFMHGLAHKILETCERVANKFLHPDANYIYMYINLHTMCKSAHVNAAYITKMDEKPKCSKYWMRMVLFLWHERILCHVSLDLQTFFFNQTVIFASQGSVPLPSPLPWRI